MEQTTPHPLVGWQDGDTTRGTLSIIKTCAATIFACTWTIQHLNVPAAHDGELSKFLRACKWMLITLLLPEFILTHAIVELSLALGCMIWMGVTTTCDPDGPGHGEIQVKYPAWMRMLWFNIPDISELREMSREATQQHRSSTGSPRPPTHTHTWTLTHAYFANMGGFVYTPVANPNSETSPGFNEPATRPLIGNWLGRYMVDQLQHPGITEAEIKDKSKTDGFAKVFSVFQVSHLVLSLIVRRAQGLPISQLEVLTLAFAVCGVATYAVYWYKPKNVSVPVSVGVLQYPPIFGFGKSFDSFWRLLTNDVGRHPDVWDRHPDVWDRIPNDNIPIAGSSGFTHHATFLLAFVSAVFSSLHAIAWNFDFPTPAEETIWHVCTILTILLPPLGLLAVPLSQATWGQGNPRDFFSRMPRKNGRSYDQGLTDTRRSDPGRLYKYLLWPEDIKFKNGPRLRQKMMDFVDMKEPFQRRPDLDLPQDYGQHLRQLMLLVDGQGSKKMVEKVAKTNVFPRRSLPTAFNKWFLYTTMGSYCLARLALVAVGLSSLRAMPEAVYKATWADYIPAI
ncbi:hypothetical protein C8A00DRAFT_30065 [Chaetomidium leptoderma]|uniref:Uncharacterized protein n=1 Tax=Chaetomidium leptoderma TaxID=669021 RepID=A0AAN6VV51_9PEZI|nr:hypothetical protein C8A00DRAFT_30065 [Chaetomidium leptoderma]